MLTAGQPSAPYSSARWAASVSFWGRKRPFLLPKRRFKNAAERLSVGPKPSVRTVWAKKPASSRMRLIFKFMDNLLFNNGQPCLLCAAVKRFARPFKQRCGPKAVPL